MYNYKKTKKMHIIIIILSLISPIYSFNTQLHHPFQSELQAKVRIADLEEWEDSFLPPVYKPKRCIHCRYFIPDDRSGKYGKCSLFPKEEEGTKEDYYYCSTARNEKHMCGKEGKLYKKKYYRAVK